MTEQGNLVVIKVHLDKPLDSAALEHLFEKLNKAIYEIFPALHHDGWEAEMDVEVRPPT